MHQIRVLLNGMEIMRCMPPRASLYARSSFLGWHNNWSTVRGEYTTVILALMFHILTPAENAPVGN